MSPDIRWQCYLECLHDQHHLALVCLPACVRTVDAMCEHADLILGECIITRRTSEHVTTRPRDYMSHQVQHGTDNG